MMISGESFGNAAPLHDYEGEAIHEAPVLVRATPVQSNSGAGEIRFEGDHLDQAVSVDSPIALGPDTSR